MQSLRDQKGGVCPAPAFGAGPFFFYACLALGLTFWGHARANGQLTGHQHPGPTQWVSDPAHIASADAPTFPVEAFDAEMGMLPAEPCYCDACTAAPLGVSCLEDGRNWAQLEYLLLWDNGTEVPVLVTTSSATTPREEAGVLGFPSTRVLFGGNTVDDNVLSGGRLVFGRWLDGQQRCGVGFEYMSVGDREVTFSGTSDDFAVLARPFFNVVTDEQDALLLGFPDTFEGSIDIRVDAEFQTFATYLRYLRRHGGHFRMDGILGWRHLRLDEGLVIGNDLEFLEDEGDTVAGTTIVQRDSFITENRFDGFELGLLGRSQTGCWIIDFGIKVALGNMEQTVLVNGQTVTTVPGEVPTTVVGGLLTQTSNIGEFGRDEFAVVPQASLSLGYQLSPRVVFRFGYNFLYANRILHAAELVDSSVNLTQQTGTLTGEARPQLVLRDGDYWLQGMMFGLDLNF